METITKDELLKWMTDVGPKGGFVTLGDDGCVKEWVPVVVGGGFSDVLPDNLRVSARNVYDAGHLLYSLGFRCARKAMLKGFQPTVSVADFLKEATERSARIEVDYSAKTAKELDASGKVLREVKVDL